MDIFTNIEKISIKYDILIIISDKLNNLDIYKKYANKYYGFATLKDFYQFIKSNQEINDNLKIAFINESKTENINDYVNLLEFYLYYRNVYKLCNQQLDIFNDKLKDDSNTIISEAINEFIRLNSDGKYIRAFLIALAYHASGGKNNDYLALATSYEIFQTSILIHDDFMDEATTRRNKETIPVHYNKKYNSYNLKEVNHLANSIAISLGDLGFFYATKIISEEYKDNKNLANIISLYSTIQMNTVKGQLLDIELPFINKYKKSVNTMENVFEIYKYKTAWYSIIGPYLLGEAIVKPNKTDIIKPLENLGIAFQIKDDLLGIYQDSKTLGKTSNDISEFKQTILYAYIKEEKQQYLNDLLKYYGQANTTISDIEQVKKIMEVSNAKNYAINKMKALFKESKTLLNKINLTQKYKNILLGFITYLEFRDK